MAAPLYTTSSGLLWHAGKILIVVAGLPARGKTHISRSLERYLRWNGVTTEVFSLGDYRRKTLGHAKALPADYFSHGAKSEETLKIRNSVRERCERDIHDFFEHAGQVAIYDANNGTKQSRRALYDRFHSVGYHVIFLESVCNNQEIVLANIRSVKISSPDYAQWDPDEAVKDYMKRIADHERHYEPVEEMDIPWIRLFNVGEKIQINKIQGYLQSRIVFFLMNIHNRQRFIYFARSGQSLIEHSYRADSDLSPSGWDYARRLKNFMIERRYLNMEERKKNNAGIAEERNLVIWTSSRRRSHHTAWPFIKDSSAGGIDQQKSPLKNPAELDEALPRPHEAGIEVPGPVSPRPPANSSLPPTQAAYSRIKVVEKSRLCEINPGVWDGLSPDDVRTRYPLEWEDFLRDPYGHRAPRAESYHDLCIRLEPILIELEDMKDDLLIISHASVIRCLLAYLVGLPAHEVPAVDIARGDLIEVQPSAYGVKTRMFHFWSGPGRKDGEVATQSMPDPTVGILTPPVSSPPRSVLHLDRTYRSRSSSQADLGDSLSMTHADHQDETHHGENHEENVSAPIDIPKPTSETQQAAILDLGLETPNASNTHGLSKSPSIPPRKVLLAANPPEPHPQQENSVAEPESPTEASKVLPKVEPSLGADEAGQVAAKIEAADTRPTFYENVVEGATKRKKTQGPTVISTLQ
ncbi:related to 6-phosphofructo-2-kinase [Serendipita indica DSM 11827]|uniref:Related to 6-phosphofructo-2-kinase n=1 Tax=Serendipita indica (strain DSM 11827) TaxID=1109443 RepID=G4THR6_SERID|nr:related to 6-phosphofructo-2-kinase [Serendipita indica DSM 11827]